MHCCGDAQEGWWEGSHGLLHQRGWLWPRSNKGIGTYSKSSKQSEGFLQGILSHK